MRWEDAAGALTLGAADDGMAVDWPLNIRLDMLFIHCPFPHDHAPSATWIRATRIPSPFPRGSSWTPIVRSRRWCTWAWRATSAPLQVVYSWIRVLRQPAFLNHEIAIMINNSINGRKTMLSR